jgi:DNA-binding SARP family transcriptional activator
MLRLTMFGGVGVRGTAKGGAALPRQTLALVALLAATPEPGVSRDALLAYLWPESDEERGRSALRQALHQLKRDLDSPELVVGSVMLRLNAELVTADLWDFDRARAAGDFAAAAAFYAGPFLSGFHVGGVPEFERWVDRQRAEYASRAAAALEALARGARERQDPTAAAEWWRRLSELDPLNTRIAMELVAALADSGNPAGALRHGQLHEALVRDELGAAPDRGLAMLLERIRLGERVDGRSAGPGPARPAQESPPAVAPPVAAVEGEKRPLSRERFLDRLARDLADRYIIDRESETSREGPVRLYRAHDRRHDRLVGLKVLHPALASQIDAERFVREIRLTGRLAHPHIMPLLDSGEVGGRPWFAVPWPEGETLRARLSREAQLPVPEALRLTRELADALGHAHAHGVVHRDVSPENVLLVGGHAMLTNLGLARALDSAAGAALTDSATRVGTPAYMSPEQAEGKPGVDGRSDVYSLAAVLFEMLVGEPLFSGPTPQAIMAKRAAEATPRAARMATLPSELVPVLRKALARSPEDRLQSMSLLASALDETGKGVSAPWLRLRSAVARLLTRLRAG